jgi:hypothetical protein
MFYEYKRRKSWEFPDLIATEQVSFLMLQIIRHVVWFSTDMSQQCTASAFTVEELAKQETSTVLTAKYHAP